MIDVVTILAENEEHLIKLDMEMPDSMMNTLLRYAKLNMPVERLLELRVEWAVQQLLKEYIETLESMTPTQRSEALADLEEDMAEGTDAGTEL